MKNYMKIVLILLAGLMPCLAVAQGDDIPTYMEEIRGGSYAAVPAAILDNTRSAGDILNALQPYLTDTVERVRAKAYYIVKRVGRKSEASAVRRQAVGILVQGISDQSSGISGNASEALTSFGKADFSPQHITTIAGLLRVETPHLDQVLKLAGYIGDDSFAAGMNQVINSNVPFKYKWAARLALARMGDSAALAYIMNKLNTAPVNDDLVYDIVPDLVYTRQMEVFEYLERIITSDEASCQSADPDSSEKILCGYRVMEYIAPAIENYPLPVDEFGYLEIDDYEAGLKEVRAWMAANETYSLVRNKY